MKSRVGDASRRKGRKAGPSSDSNTRQPVTAARLSVGTRKAAGSGLSTAQVLPRRSEQGCHLEPIPRQASGSLTFRDSPGLTHSPS